MDVRTGGWRCGYHGGNIIVMGCGQGVHVGGPPEVMLAISPQPDSQHNLKYNLQP